jgi:hypothetical protein
MALHCPSCAGPIAVNPLGRWFARFNCPHCGARLRFDRTTNLLGAIGGAAFFISGFAVAVLGASVLEQPVFQAGVAAWIVMLGLSYALRGVQRDS